MSRTRAFPRSGGTAYAFDFSWNGGADVGIALFKSWPGQAFYNRDEAVAVADANAAGQGERFDYTAPSTDTYGLVAWSNGGDVSGSQGSLRVGPRTHVLAAGTPIVTRANPGHFEYTHGGSDPGRWSAVGLRPQTGFELEPRGLRKLHLQPALCVFREEEVFHQTVCSCSCRHFAIALADVPSRHRSTARNARSCWGREESSEEVERDEAVDPSSWSFVLVGDDSRSRRRVARRDGVDGYGLLCQAAEQLARLENVRRGENRCSNSPSVRG
ncbi:MAG: hypothetical protein ACE5G2_08605 [Candidatus Krumholzibacteriia bacterium]